MPRPPRLLLSKSYYHVMTRGNNGMMVFKDDNDYHYYLKRFLQYKTDRSFDLYHYCLMPNHTHFLLQTKDATDFAIFMKQINLSYFHYFRQRYGWRGHFWQDRYKTQPVGKDNYFIQCGKYIELNPVRAKISRKPEDYPYSSYRHYAIGEENPLLTRDLFYNTLGLDEKSRRTQYRALVVSDDIVDTYEQRIWGSRLQRYNEQQKINRKISQ